MKKIKAAIVGYGNRGYMYSRYAVSNPERLEIVAVCDHDSVKLQLAKKEFSLPDDMMFCDLESFLAAKIECDVVINATMDQYHYATSIPLLKAGYNLLLEKPITANKNELLEIEAIAKEKNLKVLVCHVLRYTRFYSEIKRIIDSGEIGRIINMQLNEHVHIRHFVSAYVRGKWRNEKVSGSGLILAKCCHDTDLMCWLNNATTPAYVSSFGSKSYFCESNAPKNAADRCCDCPAKEECMFEAEKMHLDNIGFGDYVFWGAKKPIAEMTREEKIEHIRNGSFGECVYKNDMDVADRQCVSVEFENGSVGTLNVTTGGLKADRHLHVVGELGEIVGYIEENKFVLRKYNESKFKENDYSCEETVYDLDLISKLEGANQAASGHYGGDTRMMSDLCDFINGEKTTVSTTVIDDSINSHLVCYAAEEARKNKCVVDMKEFKKA